MFEVLEKLSEFPRIELGTSRTQSENHTTRPNALLLMILATRVILYFILFHAARSWRIWQHSACSGELCLILSGWKPQSYDLKAKPEKLSNLHCSCGGLSDVI